jgi:DNA-binding NarL/FixJ family response regulator
MINPPTKATIRLPRHIFRIAELTAKGYRSAEIARLVGTTDLTIKNYRQRIYDETGMSTQLELALWWRQYGSTVEALDRRAQVARGNRDFARSGSGRMFWP